MTPLASCFALLPMLGVLADVRGTLALSDTAQATLRPDTDDTRRLTVDIANVPTAQVSIPPSRRSMFVLSYSPQFVWRKAFRSDSETLVLQTAQAGYGYSWRNWQFALSESVAYGRINYSSIGGAIGLPPPNAATSGGPSSGAMSAPMPSGAAMPGGTTPTGSTPTTQFQPASRSIWILSENTSGSLGHAFSKRTSGQVSIGYGVSGPRDDVETSYLARRSTAGVTVFVGHQLSTRNSLGGAFGLNYTFTSAHFQYWIETDSLTFTHRFTRRLAGILSAGVAHAWTYDPQQNAWKFSVLPTAGAGLNGTLYEVRRRKFSLSVSFATAYAPVVNQVTGALQQTVSGGLGVVVSSDKTSISGSVSAAQTFPVDDPAAAQFIGLGLTVTHKVNDMLDLSAGYTTALQGSRDSRLEFSRRWIAFAAMTFHAPEVPFRIP